MAKEATGGMTSLFFGGMFIGAFVAIAVFGGGGDSENVPTPSPVETVTVTTEKIKEVEVEVEVPTTPQSCKDAVKIANQVQKESELLSANMAPVASNFTSGHMFIAIKDWKGLQDLGIEQTKIHDKVGANMANLITLTEDMNAIMEKCNSELNA